MTLIASARAAGHAHGDDREAPRDSQGESGQPSGEGASAGARGVQRNGRAKRARGEAIRYGLTRWQGFTRFLNDGRIEIDSNIVERSIRPIALNRKNALFAGSDEGGAAWGVVASLIETCKLNRVEPHAYLADVLAKLADGWPMSRLDELLPWAYVKAPDAVA